MSTYEDPFAKEEAKIQRTIQSVPGAIGTISTLAGDAANESKLDTNQYEAEREYALAFNPNMQTYDSAIESYYAMPYLDSVSKKDISLTAGQKWASIGKGLGAGASTGAGIGSIWGPFGTLIGGVVGGVVGTAVKGIGLGVRSSKENKFLKKENPLRSSINLRNQNSIASLVNNTRHGLASSYLLDQKAYGGPLFNFTEDFDNGIIFINTGGTHERNPLGGVPVGVDNKGVPNLVEEGEIIWNDYVFSNRLKPTKKQLKDGGFTNKYEDWTFAKIVENLQLLSSERPNDTIATNSLNDMLGEIIALQEDVRSKNKSNNIAGNVFDRGGPKFNYERRGEVTLPLNYFDYENSFITSDTTDYTTFTFKLSEDEDIANSEIDALKASFEKEGITVKVYNGDSKDPNSITFAISDDKIPNFIKALEDEQAFEDDPYFSKGPGKAYLDAFKTIKKNGDEKQSDKERFLNIKKEVERQFSNDELKTSPEEDKKFKDVIKKNDENTNINVSDEKEGIKLANKKENLTTYKKDLEKYIKREAPITTSPDTKVEDPAQISSEETLKSGIPELPILEDVIIEDEDPFVEIPEEFIPLTKDTLPQIFIDNNTTGNSFLPLEEDTAPLIVIPQYPITKGENISTQTTPNIPEPPVLEDFEIEEDPFIEIPEEFIPLKKDEIPLLKFPDTKSTSTPYIEEETEADIQAAIAKETAQLDAMAEGHLEAIRRENQQRLEKIQQERIERLHKEAMEHASKLQNTKGKNGSKGGFDLGDTFRYAPLLDNAAAYIANASSNPDYSNAKRVERASRGITRGSYTPYGQYINIPNVNRQRYLNPYFSSSRASSREFQNKGLNANQTSAYLLANEYNTQRNLGTLMASIEDMDINRKIQQETFNRGTHNLNNTDAFKALSAIQNADQIAYQGVLQGAQLRAAEDDARYKALSSNRDNITESLAGIGSENYWKKAIESSPYLRYFLTPSGEVVMKKANGGFLTIKRRRNR